MKKAFGTFLFALVLLALMPSTMRADTITSTIGPYSGSFEFPATAVPLGVFSDPALTAGTVTSATISGTFGDAFNDGTAAADLYADGILIASTPTLFSGNSTFSFNFDPADFNMLEAGFVSLSAIQNDFGFINLDTTTLTITTSTSTVQVPEPSTLALLGITLPLLVGSMRRKLFVTA
jgi:hypothetical protein